MWNNLSGHRYPHAQPAALLARFRDGARQGYMVDGEGRITGVATPGHLLEAAA